MKCISKPSTPYAFREFMIKKGIQIKEFASQSGVQPSALRDACMEKHVPRRVQSVILMALIKYYDVYYTRAELFNIYDF